MPGGTTTTTTTTHPPTTTTAPPATTTTAAPPPTTTAAPPTTTSAAPPTTTSAAPAATTTGAPGTTTTGAPGGTTTAPGATTTAGGGSGNPEISSVTVELDPDDGAEHHDHSVEVAADVKLKIKWETSGASGMHIEGLGDFDASGEQEIPTQAATYSLVAKGDGGSESTPWPLEIHVHDPADVVSPHTDVGSGVAAIVSFQAQKDDNPVSEARVGDSIDLVVVVSDATDSAKVHDEDCELSDTGDGHKQGKVTVTIADGDTGNYEAQAIKDGNPADTKQVQVDIHPAGATTTTTAAPGTTTTGQPGTTTTHPGTTTTAPGTTTSHPPTTTTAGGDWKAEWSAQAAKEGDTLQMVLTAPGLKAGTEVSFEVKIDGVDDPIATVKANADDGKAQADFKDWFKPDVIKDQQAVDADNGDKFQEVKFSFKASAGDKDATTTDLVTYGDTLELQLVDEQDQPLAKTKVIVVSPYGFASITTDDQGNVKMDGLPPGGAHITID